MHTFSLSLLAFLVLATPHTFANAALRQSGGLDKKTYEEIAQYTRLDPAARGQFLEKYEEKQAALRTYDQEHGAEMRQLIAQLEAARRGESANADGEEPAAEEAEAAPPAEAPVDAPDSLFPGGDRQPRAQPPTATQEEAAPTVPALSNQEALQRFRHLLMERHRIARQHDAEGLKLIPRKQLDSYRALAMWNSMKERFAGAHMNEDQIDQAILVCERMLGIVTSRQGKSQAEMAYDEIRNKILTFDQRTRMDGIVVDPTRPLEQPARGGSAARERELEFRGSTRAEGQGDGNLGSGASFGDRGGGLGGDREGGGAFRRD